MNTDPTSTVAPTLLTASSTEAFVELESQIESQASSLAENELLQGVVTSDPWGWHPYAFHQRASACDARYTAMRLLGELLGRSGKRLSDATFRIVRRDEGTSWDRDFGVPSSVMRIGYAFPEDTSPAAALRWHYGVAIGRVSPSLFLIWDWEA